METSSVVISSGETTAIAPVVAPAVVTPPPAANPINPPVVKDERPTWLPDKFKDAEQMALAYKELEKKQGSTPVEEKPPVAADPAQKTEKPSDTVPSIPTDEVARAELKGKGIDFDVVGQEFSKDGALSAETYTKLAAAGYDKAQVDGYIEGRIAIAEQRSTELFAVAGGKEEYGKMSAWVQANVPTAEIETYNKAVSSGDQGLAKLAIQGMHAQYTAGVGAEPVLLGGKPNAASDVFRSHAELTAAIKDPRYAKDPAYRADVEAKALRSNG